MSDCPLSGVFLLLLFPALPTRAAAAARNTDQGRSRKNMIMTANTSRTQFSGPSRPGLAKSTQAAAPVAALTRPAKAIAAPSHDEIGLRAYEIWLSTGKQSGRDQEHWFQAEHELSRE